MSQVDFLGLTFGLRLSRGCMRDQRVIGHAHSPRSLWNVLSWERPCLVSHLHMQIIWSFQRICAWCMRVHVGTFLTRVHNTRKCRNWYQSQSWHYRGSNAYQKASIPHSPLPLQLQLPLSLSGAGQHLITDNKLISCKKPLFRPLTMVVENIDTNINYANWSRSSSRTVI